MEDGYTMPGLRLKNRWSKSDLSIITNASSLVGTTAVNSILGFVFWWFAARQFTTDAVGLAAAGTAAVALVGLVSMLGFGTLLIGELPKRTTARSALIFEALLIVTVTGFVLGLGFVLLAPYLMTSLQPFGANTYIALLFSAGVGLTALCNVLDQALIGLLRGNWQLARNAIFSVSKLGFLVIIGLFLERSAGVDIFATWVVGQMLSLLGLALFVYARRMRPDSYRPTGQVAKALRGPAIAHHFLNLSLTAPGLILPLVVITLLSATDNAFFYTTWMVAGGVFVIPFALTLTLYAAGSGESETLTQKARLTVGAAFLVCAPAVLFIQFAAEYIMLIFGSAYAENASDSLRILTLGVFPLIVKDHYVAISRIHGRVASAGTIMVAGGLLEIGLATLGAYLGGLTGLSVGWMLAVVIEALIMFRPVYITVLPTRQPLPVAK